MSSPLSDSADQGEAEEFVVELATSLVVLVARWRERSSYIRCDNTGTTTQAEVQRCADELEAALRAVALDPGDKT